MVNLPPLLPSSIEYQLTRLHLRQNGFLSSAQRRLQQKYKGQGISILFIVENTYTKTLTVVLEKEVQQWNQTLENKISHEAALSAAVLENPEIKFGSFSCAENAD